MTGEFIARRVAEKLALSLSDTRVVLVSGPRQAGKSTLVRTFEGEGRRYLTLDDPAILSAAHSDPTAIGAWNAVSPACRNRSAPRRVWSETPSK